MKDYTFEITIEEKKYPLVFNLNVMEVIQEEYGSVSEWGELTDNSNGKEPNAKALIFGLTAMMNEGLEIENDSLEEKRSLLTKKQVGRLVTKAGLQNTASKLNQAVTESIKDDELKNL